MQTGTFREDLYYRMGVLLITMPPLRERIDDIALIAASFIKGFFDLDKRIKPDAIEKLKTHCWPGNIRELRNVLERAVIMSEDNTITAKDIII